jgi:endonuclease YncB( thermonuclease family)
MVRNASGRAGAMGNVARFESGWRRRQWRRPRTSAEPLLVLLVLGLIAIAGYFGYGTYVSGTFHHCGTFNQRNCVVDGDTIHYEGMKIRIADIDTPEVSEPKCAHEAELGRRATLRLLELMNAGPFEIVRAGGRDEDRYGRKLRIIERNGRSLGDVLVAEGLAHRWDGARHGWCG